MKKTVKKILLLGGLLFAFLAPVTSLTSESYAALSADVSYAEGRSILGLRPWYYGLTDGSGNVITPEQSDLGAFVAQIALNVVNDLMAIAGVLVTGFIIYGGYLYMFSEGDAGKVAKGKNTIKMATIGAIIVLSANIIFNTISIILLKETGDADYVVSYHGSSISLPDLEANLVVKNMIDWALSLGGLAAVAFVVYGGVSYMTAAGDAGKLAKAKNSIKYALIGLLIVVLATVLTNFIFDTIIQAQA